MRRPRPVDDMERSWVRTERAAGLDALRRYRTVEGSGLHAGFWRERLLTDARACYVRAARMTRLCWAGTWEVGRKDLRPLPPSIRAAVGRRPPA